MILRIVQVFGRDRVDRPRARTARILARGLSTLSLRPAQCSAGPALCAIGANPQAPLPARAADQTLKLRLAAVHPEVV